MKFFIDSADVGEIRKAHEMGCVDGVTTNPSLLAKVGRNAGGDHPGDLLHRGRAGQRGVRLAAPLAG